MARLIEPGILPQDRRKDGADHEILDRAVGEISSVTLAVAFRSLMESGFAVLSLADAGKYSIPDELPIIERASRHRFVLLAGGKRRNLARVFQSEEIRHQAEEPVIGCTGLRRRNHIRNGRVLLPECRGTGEGRGQHERT